MAITPTAAQNSILMLNVAMFGQAAGTTVMAAALPTFKDGNTYAQTLVTSSDAYKILSPEQAFTKVINNLSVGTGVTAADVEALAKGMVEFVNAGLTVGATINLLTAFLYQNQALTNVWANTAVQLLNKTTAASVYTLDQNNAAASTDAIANVTYRVDTNLTVYTDIKSGTLFESSQAYTPGGDDFVNTLQDVDKLTGTATDGSNTLNATLGNFNDNGAAVIMPELNNINIVNAAFVSTGGANQVTSLDLQDTTGLNEANFTRVAQVVNYAEMGNIQSVLAKMGIFKSNANQAGTIEFSFGSGVLQGENTGALKVSDVALLNVNIGMNATGVAAAGVATQGYEHLTIESTGTGTSNTIMNLNTPMDTGTNGEIKIIGDKALTLATNVQISNGNLVEAMTHGGGINTTNGRLATISASGMTAGSLAINLGAGTFSTGKADTSGVVQNVTVTGSDFADTFYLSDTVQAGDSIIGGLGSDTLVAYQGNVAGKVSAVENVDVQLRNANVTLDFANIADATWINVRNITSPSLGTYGATLSGDNGADQIATLNNLTATMAAALNTQHATTGNNGIADTTIVANLASASGAADLVGLTINEGVNVDPRYNLTLQAGGAAAATKIENIKVTDSDTESNSVQLTNYASHTGTITLTGGVAGTFLNLDVNTANVNPRAALEAAYAAAVVAADAAPTAANLAAAAAALAAINAFATNVATTQTAYQQAVTTSNLAGITGALAAFNAAENANNLQGLQARDTTGGSGDGVGYRDVAALATETRLVAAVIDASGEASNVTVRVSTTAANTDGGQKITMGSGDDVVIFDDITAGSSTYTTAGLTFADTVAGGAGNNMLTIDGNGTNVILQKSEWDNVSQFQTIYLAGNGGNTYFLELDNDMIAANGTNGNMITILNKDGSYIDNTAGAAGTDSRITNNAAVINALDLNAGMHFTYTGEAASGATADRFVVNDQNTNGGNIIRGGDVNTLVSLVAGATYGTQVNGVQSLDILEIRNTATATTADLANITDVGTIVLNNDQATTQTLNLTLNSTVLDAMSDSGHTATTTSAEAFTITANDGLMRDATGAITAPAAASALTVNARAVSGAFGLTINGDTGAAYATGLANDTVSATVNLGGVAQNYNLSVGNDTVNLYGIAATDIITAVAGGLVGTDPTKIAYTFTSATGLTTQVFNMTGVDALNLYTSAGAAVANVATVTAAASAVAVNLVGSNTADAITCSANGDTVNGAAGNDTITGGAGADIITGATGIDTIALAAGGADVVSLKGVTTAADRDVVTGFTVATSIIGIDAANTTAGTAVGAAAVTSTSAVAAANGTGTAFNLAGVGSTATRDMIILQNGVLTNTANANLALAVDGTEFLKATVAAGAGNTASGFTMTGASNKLYVLTSDAVNSYLYFVNDADGSGLATAAEITLVGTFAGDIDAVANTVMV